VYIQFYLKIFVCLLHLWYYLSALITSGENRDAVYFQFTKSSDSLPIASLWKSWGDIDWTGGWTILTKGKKAFTMRVVKHWSRLFRGVLKSQAMDKLKPGLDHTLNNPLEL